jgi:membrane protease YdiL (CAAX protease family)
MTLPESHPLTHPELPEGVEPPPARPSRGDGDREGLPPWPPWAPLVAFLGALMVALVASVLIVVFVEAAGTDVDSDNMPSGVTIGATIAQGLGFIGFAVLLARVTSGVASPQAFGLRRTRLWPAVGWTALAWAAFLAFSAAWAAALSIDENDDLPQELGADESTAALVAVILMVTLLAPVAEELFFRGFLFTALRRWIGLLPGALITGVVFGGIHAGGTDTKFLVPLMVLGAILCFLYWKTNSLLAPMALHAVNNSIALGVALEWPAWAFALTILGSVGVIVAGGLALSRFPRGNRPEPVPAA